MAYLPGVNSSGVVINKQQYDRKRIQKLCLHKSYSAQSGGEHSEIFSIKRILAEAKK